MPNDLLNSLGSKASTEGTGSPASSQTGQAVHIDGMTSSHNTRGANMIDQAGKKSESTAATGEQTSVEASGSSTSTKNESSSTAQGDAGSWTVESALKEVKKLREENKASRLKYEESVEKLKTESELRMNATKQETEAAMQAKKELEDLKAKEADRKRNLEERLAHREGLVSELQTKSEMIERGYKEKLSQAEQELNRYRAESEAQAQVYKTRLEAEIASIPEKFKDLASYIVKGAGDPRDALVAISEAKIKGVFEDKTVIVNHSVPGANDGARVTSKAVQDAAKAERDKMTPQQKVKAALQGMRSGTPNSAFRQR